MGVCEGGRELIMSRWLVMGEHGYDQGQAMTTAAMASLWDVNLGYPAAKAASPGSPCVPFVISLPSFCFSLASLHRRRSSRCS